MGKPFTAVNPEAVKKPDALAQDERLQTAIKKYLPAQPRATKSVMQRLCWASCFLLLSC